MQYLCIIHNGLNFTAFFIKCSVHFHSGINNLLRVKYNAEWCHKTNYRHIF
ncbi:hypothetical protein MuYL_2029 [Mucilaginibacter xinganensis]|uniref:Uncharacterized protein n=1 Tax=Mucilaginibacter xinganensis TaxID=1234841 RepID=A0A223NWJ8_9SPHI|nr:hypothetical protein MuYL_2029 [Mucilaginibacter xinganensis]